MTNKYVDIDGQKVAALVTWDARGGGAGGGGPTADGNANTGTASAVNDTASDATILAANDARYGATIWNDSTAVLYLLLGAGTASATNCSVKIIADGYYEVPYGYTGIIKGIWAADASGAARVTEFT